MAKSVELLKEAVESEESSIFKYEEALKAMVHDESKITIKSIIESKKGHIASIRQIIDNSRKCPAIKD